MKPSRIPYGSMDRHDDSKFPCGFLKKLSRHFHQTKPDTNTRYSIPNGPLIRQPPNSTFFVDTPFPRYENVEELEVSQTMEDPDRIYDKVVEYCARENVTFIDDSFPHSMKSIGNLANLKKFPNQTLIWLRPAQIYTKDGLSHPWTVFNNPQPSDVEQGHLIGNCWLLSAMALISENLHVLNQLFVTSSYSHLGVYKLRICVEGNWKTIIVDDFFPCYSHSKSLAMGISRRNQLWVPLLEKALAKEMGSYAKLHGASLSQGLSMLTGANCVNYQTNETEDNDVLWARIVSSKESGFLMSCASGNDEQNRIREMGLLENHAYSILDTAQFGLYRLVRLRNPWGSFVWKGKFSDQWSGWSEEMKQALLYNRQNETGAFWMEFQEFCSLFNFVTVCKLRPSWFVTRFSLINSNVVLNNSTSFVIETADHLEISITAFQTNQRNENETKDLILAVHRINNDMNIGELIERSPRITDKYVNTDEFFLKPGKYVITCYSMKLDENNYVNINGLIHSSRKIHKCFQMTLTSKMMVDSIWQIARRDGELVETNEPAVIVRTLSKNFRGLVITAENVHENKYLQISADFTNSMNIQSSRGSLLTTDVIPPLSCQIIAILSTIDDFAQYRIVNNLKTLLCNQKRIIKQMNPSAVEMKNYPPLSSAIPSIVNKSFSLFSTFT